MYVCINSLKKPKPTKTKASKSHMGLCVGKKTWTNLRMSYRKGIFCELGRKIAILSSHTINSSVMQSN